MTAPATYRPPVPAAVKAVGPRTAEAVLTTASPDVQGDIVHPAGLDLAPFAEHPRVNWFHCCPVGRGTAALKARRDTGEPALVGTTRFFERASDLKGLSRRGYRDNTYSQLVDWSPADCLSAAEAVWRLVEDGSACGVSIEFDWAPDAIKALPGKRFLTPAGPRGPLEISRGELHGYAHTPTGAQINLDAMLLLKSSGAFDRITRIAETGKVGGYPLPRHIHAAYADALKAVPARPPTVVSGYTPGVKAMPDEYDAPADQPTPADGTPDEMTPDEMSDTTATADAAFSLADLLASARETTEAKMAKGEHKQGKAQLRKLLDTIDAAAEKAAAIGEKVEADSGDEPAAEGEGDPADDDADDSDLGDDEMPALKATRIEGGRVLRPVAGVLKAWPRLRASDLTDLPAAGKPDEAQIKALIAANDRLTTGNRRSARRIDASVNTIRQYTR